MVDISSRHRPLALLAAIVFAQVLLLAFQIKRQRDVRLIRVWSVELLTPLQRVGTWFFHGVGGSWHHYIDLRDARAENERMRAELGRLQLRNRELEGRAAEQERLVRLLNFREAHTESPMLAALVIGAGADSATRTVYINRGEHEGVRRNMAVITPDGIVGKTVEVFAYTSQVLLITDKESGVGALLTKSRTHGVIKGTGEPFVHLDYVINGEAVQPGDEILTSGEDRIFPKDLPAGIVVGTQPGNPFKVINVQPAARLDRLEEVLVLLMSREPLRRETESATAKPGTATPAGSPASKPPNAAPSRPAGPQSQQAATAVAPQKTAQQPGAVSGAPQNAATTSATTKKPPADSAAASAAAGSKPPGTAATTSATPPKKTPAAKKPADNSAAAPADASKSQAAPGKPAADKPADKPPAEKPSADNPADKPAEKPDQPPPADNKPPSPPQMSFRVGCGGRDLLSWRG
jgi:rod shape-determining protein MreC